jgi:rod shape-determining protein MreD
MNGVPRAALTALVLILVILHFVLRVGVGLAWLVPDLLVVAVLLAARHLRGGSAAGVGFLLGVLEGAVVPDTFGASALVLAVLGYLGSRTRNYFAGYSPVFLAFYLFAGKWLHDLLLYLVVLADARTGPASALLVASFPAAVYAAAAGVLAYSAYRTLS